MLSVIIVGLGRIGVGRGADESLPNHLKSVLARKDMRITGLVDTQPDARGFIERQHPELAPLVCNHLSDVTADDMAEVIAISTPTAQHEEALEQALSRAPCLIVLEKPAADEFESAKRMLVRADENSGKVLVNFHRRFDPRHRRFRAVAPSSPRQVIARYGKGLWNYASHIVDLLMDWYGPIETVQALAERRPEGGDPNISFRCRMADGFDAVLIGIDGLNYDQFEIDIFGANEAIEIRGGGGLIRRLGPTEGLYHKGYAGLEEQERTVGIVDGLPELYGHIASHLNEGSTLGGCDLATAVANAAVLNAALLSAEGGGIPVAPAFSISNAA